MNKNDENLSQNTPTFAYTGVQIDVIFRDSLIQPIYNKLSVVYCFQFTSGTT
jgi:hypothetical protein